MISSIIKFIFKVYRKFWSLIVLSLLNRRIYPYLYRSYLHYRFKGNSSFNLTPTVDAYFAARPNPGAGIGHQIANWIAGYWFAKQFKLKFAHIPFSISNWEEFLGFGIEEITHSELKKRGYKYVVLPLFNENNSFEIDRTEKIIQSYLGRKIVFICEQDQFYGNQYGVINEINSKFYSAPSRLDDNLIYSDNNLNIALHVRRGDVLNNQTNPNIQMRYISNDYFIKVLVNFKSEKPVHIYFFSQGNSNDFPEFEKYENLHWCFDMNAQQSFLHMVYANILITSKSSFSYKPALLNKGIKVCPKNFWHGYPSSEDWILVDDSGEIVKT